MVCTNYLQRISQFLFLQLRFAGFALLMQLTGLQLYAQDFAYVPNYTNDNVSVINLTTNAVVATIPVGFGPFGVAVTPDGTQAYVTNQFSASVSVIDAATNTVIATVGVGTGYPDTQRMGIPVFCPDTTWNWAGCSLQLPVSVSVGVR